VGGGGGHSLPFVVVGTRCVFIVLVYRSRMLMGRGGVMWRVLAANRQWAVDGGGAGLVGWVVIDVVGLLTVSIQNDDIVIVIVPRQSALGPWGAVFMLLCAGHCHCYVWL